jgi:medium-chain acyl-[acyl-carrier-protein] hydrolase
MIPCSSTANPWILRPNPNSQAKLRLFCFPYAGGGAAVFRDWSKALPATIEVCLVELPGHGTRLRERPCSRLLPLIEAIVPFLLPYLDKPFAFFGHSMGGLISFELARLLRRCYHCLPVHLCISGRRAPQISNSKCSIYALPEPEFLQELRRLNGTPPAVLESADLMQVFLPILRSDFEILETYCYRFEPPLACPITVLGGLQDSEVSYEELKAWQEQTASKFAVRMLPGDHFFPHSFQSLLLQILIQGLSNSSPDIFN